MRIVALWCVLGAFSTWAAEPKLSTPKEVLEALERSPKKYAIHGIEALDVARGRLAEEQWKPLVRAVDLPKVTRRKTGVTVTSWPAPSSAAQREMNLAEDAFRVKDYAEAEAHYRAATKLAPTYYLAHAYLGDALLFGDKKDEAGALAAYEKAISLNPDDYRLYFFRSTVHRRLGHRKEAVVDLRHSLLLKPRNETLLNLVRNARGVNGLRAETELFVPRAFVRATDEGVDIFVDADRTEWLAWANCKALWLGEPAYRKARGAGTAGGWSSQEDYECLVNLITVYVSEREAGRGTHDDRLERLEAVAKEGLLDAMVLYEFGSRVDPAVTLKLPEAQRAQVERYIERYVLTDSGAKE